VIPVAVVAFQGADGAVPLVVGLVALFLVGTVVFRAVVVVDAYETGVLTAGGEVRAILDPGLHVVAPVGRRVTVYERPVADDAGVELPRDDPGSVAERARARLNDDLRSRGIAVESLAVTAVVPAG